MQERLPLPERTPEGNFALAAAVDREGAAGKGQAEIAGRYGLTRHQMRLELMQRGFTWSTETRVWVANSGERVADALQRFGGRPPASAGATL